MNAFTLTELVVALLISSILVAGVYLLLNMVQSHFKISSETAEKVVLISNMRHVLLQDFEKSRYIVSHGNSFSFHSDSTSVTYDFNPSLVSRSVEGLDRVDTFNIRSSEPLAYFNGALAPSGRLVNVLSFDLYLEEDTFQIYLHKTYAAQELMMQPKYIQSVK